MNPSRALAVLVVCVVAACTPPALLPPTTGSPYPRPSDPLALVIEQTITATVLGSQPPASKGPVRVIDAITLVDDRLGFLAGRSSETSRDGVIQQTRDGGSSWRTVWRGRRRLLAWVGPVGSTIRAIGYRPTATGTLRSAFLLTSRDEGATWTRTRARMPELSGLDAWLPGYTYQAPTARLLIASPDLAVAPCCSGPPLISRDGGRTWRELRIGGAFIRSVDFAGAAGMASISADDGPCGASIWLTTDAGRHWRPAVAACIPGPSAGVIHVLDASTAYVGTGRWDSAMGSGASFVWRTTDGGSTWDRVLRTNGGTTMARIMLDDASNGLVATGGCASMGGEGPCIGPFLRVVAGEVVGNTRVTGYRWSSSGTTVLASAPESWAGEGLARSIDGGTTWERSVRPEDVSSWRLVASPTGIAIRTPLGRYASTDAGSTWRAIDNMPEREPRTVRRDLANDTLRFPTHTVRMPRGAYCFPSALDAGRVAWVVCSDDRVLVTSDGGTTFEQINMPARTWIQSIAPVSATEAWAAAGPGYGLLHTTDGGRSWTPVWPDVPGVSTT